MAVSTKKRVSRPDTVINFKVAPEVADAIREIAHEHRMSLKGTLEALVSAWQHLPLSDQVQAIRREPRR